MPPNTWKNIPHLFLQNGGIGVSHFLMRNIIMTCQLDITPKLKGNICMFSLLLVWKIPQDKH